MRKTVIDELEDNSLALRKLKNLLSEKKVELASEFLELGAKYLVILDLTNSLEARNGTVEKAMNGFNQIREMLDFDMLDDEKLEDLLGKNEGLKSLYENNLDEYSLQEKLLLQKAPVVAMEVERVFSQYLAFLRGRRLRLTKENIVHHCILAINKC